MTNLDRGDVDFAIELIKKGLAARGLTARGLTYPLAVDFSPHTTKPDWAWPLPREPEPKGELPAWVEEYNGE